MSGELKRHKYKIIGGIVVVAALAFTFWYGGNAPGLRGWTAEDIDASATSTLMETHSPAAANPDAQNTASRDRTSEMPTVSGNAVESAEPMGIYEEDEEQSSEEASIREEEPGGESKDDANEPTPTPEAEIEESPDTDENASIASDVVDESSPGVEEGDADYSLSQGMEINPATGLDRYLTAPVPEGRPLPVEPQDTEITDRSFTVWLSVRCDTILGKMDWLNREKWELVPEDGIIFPRTQVTVYEGESVFNVLQREMRRAGIHMAHRNTPMYNSAYIEAINNLYEFDVGELSGWMYKVDDWFPNYGASRYLLQPGNEIEWVYTCSLGVDVGGHYAIGG